MTDVSSGGIPEFAVVVRGYDREQVDGYLTDLMSLIAQLRDEAESLRQRAEQAEASLRSQPEQAPSPAETPSPAQPSWSGLGAEVSALLDQAQAAAESRRKEAEQEAAAILEAARTQENRAAAQLEALRRRWEGLVGGLERLRGEVDGMLAQAREPPGEHGSTPSV